MAAGRAAMLASFALQAVLLCHAETLRPVVLGKRSEASVPALPKPAVGKWRGGGKSSVSASVFNLVNNVAGAGILTLPAGMGAGTGLAPAIALTVFLGMISAHTFERIGEAADLTGEVTFKGIWSATIGKRTAWVVDAAIFFMCMSAAIIYAGIMGDVLTSLLALCGTPWAYNHRSANIVALTASVLLPLSLQRNLSGLAFTSLLGFAAVVYTVIFMVARALDGSYAASGRWGSKLPADMQPNFDGFGLWTLGAKALVLINNLGLAFIAHYNAPVFYRELEVRTLSTFRRVVRRSFLVITTLYAVTMVAGFFTFGRSTASNILNSYHGADPLAVVGRVATGLSVLFGFPLAFVGLREAFQSLSDLLPQPAGWLARNHKALVLTLVSCVCAVACIFKDIGVLVGVSGAVLGSMVVYIFPALIWMKAAARQRERMPGVDAPLSRLVNMCLVPFGAFVSVLGVVMSLREAQQH